MPELAVPADPRRYFETVAEARSPIAQTPPVCVYLEVTNCCNLLCETCPRTPGHSHPFQQHAFDLLGISPAADM